MLLDTLTLGRSNNFVTYLVRRMARFAANVQKGGNLMNHKVSAYVRNHETKPTIKNRITLLLSAGIALCAVFGGVPCADAAGFLPDQMIVSPVPPNGDVNPYGVAFVPQGFPNGGPL